MAEQNDLERLRAHAVELARKMVDQEGTVLPFAVVMLVVFAR
jgi:hypothetical protein